MPTRTTEPLRRRQRDTDTNGAADNAENGAGMHWPCLLIALAIMFGITLYPPLLANANGKADHGLASLLFLAMSSGFVRGVGFVPHAHIWRSLFSVAACYAALALALLLALWPVLGRNLI